MLAGGAAKDRYCRKTGDAAYECGRMLCIGLSRQTAYNERFGRRGFAEWHVSVPLLPLLSRAFPSAD